MKSTIVRFAAALAAMVLAGCAGTDFVRVADDALVLGRTTEGEIRTRLGAPYREGVVTQNGRQIRTASYAYAHTGAEGAAAGVVAARSQGFFFFNDKLVGYEFISSWKEDSTDFDGAKVAQIHKGQSTVGDVTRLFGRPGGRYIHPMIKGEAEEAVNYLYHQTTGSAFNLKFAMKKLIVTYNRQGVVTEVEYAESGQN
ncbi:MAG: hypothetical protein ACT4P9_14840 [Betaproteobacteria bacterium]